MGDWNPVGLNRAAFDDDQSVSPWNVTVTANASANTKGNYTALAASLAFDCIGIILSYLSSQSAYTLLDIAVGAGGSEQVVVPNFGVSNPAQAGGAITGRVFIPLAIPKGTRVAARIQTSNGGLTVTTKVTFVGKAFPIFHVPQRYEDWGADTTASFGTAVTAGNAAKGSFVQLKASTGLTARWVSIEFESVTAGSGTQITVDLAVGAAASEQVVIPDVFGDVGPLGCTVGPIPLTIPQGSRISARCAEAGGTASVKIHAHGGG